MEYNLPPVSDPEEARAYALQSLGDARSYLVIAAREASADEVAEAPDGPRVRLFAWQAGFAEDIPFLFAAIGRSMPDMSHAVVETLEIYNEEIKRLREKCKIAGFPLED